MPTATLLTRSYTSTRVIVRIQPVCMRLQDGHSCQGEHVGVVNLYSKPGFIPDDGISESNLSKHIVKSNGAIERGNGPHKPTCVWNDLEGRRELSREIRNFNQSKWWHCKQASFTFGVDKFLKRFRAMGHTTSELIAAGARETIG